MNIYLKIEILERELEGRLLLALVAAERGHDVLLGDFRSLLSHRFWLRPGIFHDKSVTPSAPRLDLLQRLQHRGFAVTSQDEEHGLSEASYEPFARRRFSEASIGLADTIFTWGPHDDTQLQQTYPDHASRFQLTGSPRVDVWRQDLAGLQGPRPEGFEERPYVLFSTSAHPFQPTPFWVMLRDARPSQFPDAENEREWVHYEKLATSYGYVSGLVRAIRRASRALPDVQFVVRPHPTALPQAWRDVLGPVGPNVHVIKDGGSGRWIEHALAVVHNGSTTGIEASARGIPTISFRPNGERSDMFANRFGQVATDDGELADIVRAVREPSARAEWLQRNSPRELLAQRFAALDGPLAADRITDRWEELDRSGLNAANRHRTAYAASRIHRIGGRSRVALRAVGQARSAGPDFSAKFPPLDVDRARALVRSFQTVTGRFGTVAVERLGPRLLHLTS